MGGAACACVVPAIVKMTRSADSSRVLESLLSEANLHRLEYGLPLEITGSDGGEYRLYWMYSSNVQQLASGRWLCAVPKKCQYSIREMLTTQIIHLLTNEQGFLTVAVASAAPNGYF